MSNRCIHSFHATSETGADLGWVCAFCHRPNRLTPGIIVQTNPTLCESMCAHFEEYIEPTHKRTTLYAAADALLKAYMDEWGKPPLRNPLTGEVIWTMPTTLDIADHPKAFQRQPAPPRRELPMTELLERYK